MDTLNYDQLNPGIRATVRWLREHGFSTCDSGDGQTHEHECDLPCPYVHMAVSPEMLIQEAKRLSSSLKTMGVTLLPMDENMTAPCLECQYNPANDVAIMSLYNVRL